MSPGFYKHTKNLDVVFELYWSYDDGFSHVATGRWWNLGYTGKPWPLDEDRIHIVKKDAANWKYMGEECPLRRMSNG